MMGTDDDKSLPARSTGAEIDAFLAKVAATPRRPRQAARGRLIFAMDATASRQPTWDQACELQAEMFGAAKDLGGLEVQLVFYRGWRECRASPWTQDPDALRECMTGVMCRSGLTQIGRVLRHALKELGRRAVNALVFVGDRMEEDPEQLTARAGDLGLRGVPVFVFQEGRDPVAERTFRAIARLSGGAWCPFDQGSADQLRRLLSAIATFAAGGTAALEHRGREDETARLIARQLRLTHGKESER
jgi:hypothetical protein